MDTIKTIQGDLLARDLKFVIVAARFNDFIVESLVRGAIDTLKRHGATEKNIELVRVPGAFGVLTTDNIEQAIERAGTKAGNKGVDAALVALEMANLLPQLGR